MNRRNLLIGIGTAAVGTGGVLGSGALTQVNAERSVTIGVSGDSSALLGLNPSGNVDEVSTNSGEIEFNLPSNLNDKAVTKFGGLDESAPEVTTAAFTIANNSDTTSNSSDELKISATVYDSTDSEATNAEILKLRTVTNSSITDLTSGNISLTAGGSTDVMIEVDTTNATDYSGNGVDIDYVTFTAEPTQQ